MRLQISFPIGTFKNTGLAFSFAIKHFNCKMASIFSNKAFPSNDWIIEPPEIESLLAVNNDNSFIIHDGSEPDAHMYDDVNMATFIRDRNYQTEIITFDIKEEACINLEELLISADALKFNVAQKFDYEKARWQSEQVVSNFEVFNKEHEQRRKVVHPVWGASTGLTIDISNNPGRDILTFGMRLFAAPEMWFGPGAWKFFRIEDIMSCPVIKKSNKLTNELLYIKLFDADLADYEDEFILNLQRKFRSCSKMGDVEHLLNGKLGFKRYY